MTPPRIYLDHAATTPVLPAARAAVAEGLERWANPSSPHAEGRAAKSALEQARARVAAVLDWRHDVLFTSGASEGLAIALHGEGRRVLASAVEHDAVFRAAPTADRLPVMADGVVDREGLTQWLQAHPGGIVAVQQVNSETGVVQPLDEVSGLVRRAGGILLADCSQGVGKMVLPDADIIVFSAHKFGGPPGVGALLVRDLGLLRPTGGQERGYRAGTQNLPGILGMAAALEWSASDDGRWLDRLRPALAALEEALLQAGARLQPARARRAGHILSVTMPSMSAAAQLVQFDLAGVAVSAGSACSSGTMKRSRVLIASGVAEEEADCTIRVSAGWSTSEDELSFFADIWKRIAAARARAA